VTPETSCPVCGLEHIPPDKTKCPQCDADLTCFKILDSLPDEPVRNVKIPRTWVIAFYAIAMVICLVTAMTMFQYYQFRRVESLLMDQQKYLSDEGRSSEVSERGQDTGILHTVPGEPDFLVYDAIDTDTLWDISKRYYGSGRYYPVLLEHNPHLGIYAIGDGVRIKILKDAGMARDIYLKMSMTKGDRTYWNYAVAEGDTLRSVARKFYRTEKMAKQISDLNPDVRLQSGQRIWMLLE